MAKTRDKVIDRASGARPYIERAFKDEDLRDNVRNAYESARVVYNELIGGRGAIPVATRVATDKDIQDHLREALDELRQAADRVQGKKDHGGRNALLLLTGIALGVLFNPVTGSADAQVVVRPGLRAERRVHLSGRNSSPSSN